VKGFRRAFKIFFFQIFIFFFLVDSGVHPEHADDDRRFEANSMNSSIFYFVSFKLIIVSAEDKAKNMFKIVHSQSIKVSHSHSDRWDSTDSTLRHSTSAVLDRDIHSHTFQCQVLMDPFAAFGWKQ
jgi:hypothetical protein